ncbi:MAG: F0F1 ATP synthase subunit gamma [Candidatus Nanopelagicales bacterium]
MGAQLRVFRGRIKSVKATKKITKAMELIASSRIVKAQQRVLAATPYTDALVRAISAAASNGSTVHPLTHPRGDERIRAAVCFITADRGLAGGYSSNVIREAEALTNLLHDEGLQVKHFIVGNKGVNYYRFRERPIAARWTGFTDQPKYEDAQSIAQGLLEALHTPVEEGGVDEIHIVFTHFKNMAQQEVRVRRLIPMEVVEVSYDEAKAENIVVPLYDFEPGAEQVLDALLPKYVTNLVWNALLVSAASEHAARRRAMKSATDNAEELIKSLTRQANQARQAEITQEISEIVGGADALAAK